MGLQRESHVAILHIAVYSSALQCVPVCCSVLQYDVVFCSVWQSLPLAECHLSLCHLSCYLSCYLSLRYLSLSIRECYRSLCYLSLSQEVLLSLPSLARSLFHTPINILRPNFEQNVSRLQLTLRTSSWAHRVHVQTSIWTQR